MVVCICVRLCVDWPAFTCVDWLAFTSGAVADTGSSDVWAITDECLGEHSPLSLSLSLTLTLTLTLNLSLSLT